LAYSCLGRTTRQATNFNGKAECKRLLAELNRPDTSIGYLQRVARRVATSFPDERERDIEEFRQLVELTRPKRPAPHSSKRRRVSLPAIL
jgi:hypothetical protein